MMKLKTVVLCLKLLTCLIVQRHFRNKNISFTVVWNPASALLQIGPKYEKL